MEKKMRQLPMVALRGLVVMPGTAMSFDLSRKKSIEAVQRAMEGEQKIFLSAQKSIEIEDPTQEDLYQIGTIATVRQIVKLPKQIVRVMVSGEQRGILQKLESEEPFLLAEVLEINNLHKLVDEIASSLQLFYTEQQELLEQLDFWKRYELLTFKLVNEVEIMDVKNEIRMKVKERVDKHQREYILREEMKYIREELGDADSVSDAAEFE